MGPHPGRGDLKFGTPQKMCAQFCRIAASWVHQRAFDAVAADVVRGEPLVKCQLRASEFYEALQRELRQPLSIDDANRSTLIAAANRCERAAIAGTDLSANAERTWKRSCFAAVRSANASFRVIEGGLSTSKSPGAIFSSSAVRLGRDVP
jgi:hypothetical protein